AASRLAKETEARVRKAEMQERVRLTFERAESARRSLESDPGYIAKRKQRELRSRYGIHEYVEDECFSRLMAILKRVDTGQRLNEEDFLWLSTTGKDYFTDELRAAYHRLEADSFADAYRKSRDAWAAVNASSHYRKGNRADQAADLQYIDPSGFGISARGRAYLAPLITGEVRTPTVDGLPQYAQLKLVAVRRRRPGFKA
ncbi:MAG: hypothetical protein ACK540_03395, partial [Betaproteobacteria bacterium]